LGEVALGASWRYDEGSRGLPALHHRLDQNSILTVVARDHETFFERRPGGRPATKVTLKQTAERAGILWAEEQIAALGVERRAVSGGFPGTVREARARFAGMFVAAQDAAEAEAAMRTAYAAARRAWLSKQRPEEDDDPLL
jgi:hypothetical protein